MYALQLKSSCSDPYSASEFSREHPAPMVFQNIVGNNNSYENLDISIPIPAGEMSWTKMNTTILIWITDVTLRKWMSERFVTLGK